MYISYELRNDTLNRYLGIIAFYIHEILHEIFVKKVKNRNKLKKRFRLRRNMWEFRLGRFHEMSVNIVCEAYADWRTFSTNCATIDNDFTRRQSLM